MNATTTTTTTHHIQTHHGQSRLRPTSGDMDISPRHPGDLERGPQSDVMDMAVDSAQPTATAQTDQTRPSTSTNALPLPHITLSPPPQSDEAPIFTPLLLGKKEYAFQRPHPSQDLLSLYGLSSLAASVARCDPITGEKVNKMRKSYEGQVKTFGLAGRNKAVKHEDGAPGGLMELIAWPDEEWQNQKVAGKELEKGLSSATLAKLERAMKMEPGPVPKNDEWENILGHEKLKPLVPAAETKGKAAVPPNGRMPNINGHMNGMTVGTPAMGEAARPKRTGRKRRYDEHSFEGYGEGYVDDEGEMLDAGGYSSGDGSRKSNVSKKKRKKDYPTIPTSAVPERAGSYGVGMMHVPTGIGTYGR